MRLKDKVAIITGVDAAGIGQATALLFAEAGATVVLLGGDEQDGIETISLIRKGGGDALLLNLDIARESDVKQACEDTVRAFGKLDILVNSDAGFVPRASEAGLGSWGRFPRVNAIGNTALMNRYAVEAMKRQDKGAIVNIVTLSGPRPQSAAYGATSAALMQMTREMAVDLAPDNIRVNCVCHGDVRSVKSLENIESPDQTAAADLLSRTGRPSEVAYAILFLASDEASFITGTNVVVDGGHYGMVKSSFQQRISSRVASFS